MRVGVGVFLLGSAGIIFGQQQQFWQPEVRRALPVEKPSPTPGAGPQGHPCRETCSHPAFLTPSGLRFRTPHGWIASNLPRLRSQLPVRNRLRIRPQGRIVVAPSSPAPAVATPVPQSSPEAENGDIRLSPSTANRRNAPKENSKLANSTYSRKMYDYAIQGYEKFLITYPSAKGRDVALFRLAECHRMLGNEESARSGYERLLQEFRQGEFAGAGAYRLGEYLYADKKVRSCPHPVPTGRQGGRRRRSAPFSQIQHRALSRPPEASRRSGQTLRRGGRRSKEQPLSLLCPPFAGGKRCGRQAAERRRWTASRISPSGSAPSAVRAEAAVKAASLAAELGDKQRALKLFNAALALPESGDWKPTAFLGAIRLNFELGAYKKVVEMSEKVARGNAR